MTSENIDKNLDDPKLIAAKTITFGALIIGTFLSIFVIWGVIAPINSASIAQGQVVLDFNKKTIQHLEGGIIEDILVKEGQYVVTNQPLIYLQDIQSRSQNKMLRKQLVTALAIEARLIAERDNSNPDFTKILEGYNTGYISENNEINKIISTQANLYQIRQTTLTSKKDILEKRIDQLSDEIAGITSQLQATDEELKLLKKQERMSQKLVKNNNSPLNKLIEIQKQIAAAKGKKGELEANIAKAKQTISETELEIINLVNENLNDIIAELQDIEVKVSDLTEELVSAKDVLKRTMIKSPTSGIVTDLKYHTIGAVISPANEIMYIVPKDDQLIIEARINPNDIDNVVAGQKAKVQLTAFKAKKVPKLTGEVLSVSADILTDEQSSEQYFLARIKIDDSEINKLKEKITLYPGMPALGFIITGSRSLLDYLFDPITDASYKAFREE
ncbi:MAG: HlyD family type I secretion periplasmic adaptor subunit [Alphaproteobacteria bacterium]|jgi:HlyD family type I secretion membrane fusion protein|nr:HlyD family type I secretion periplasmic adaptor subunit [Alphaproteobacteria bacterium]